MFSLHSFRVGGRLTFRGRFALAIAALTLVASGAVAAEERLVGASFDAGVDAVFPNGPNVVDVTKAPYFARGDGVADDSDALQRALDDAMGRHKMLYLPTGVYLVSRTLKWSKKNSDGGDAWGFNFVQGQNVLKTVIRLKDGTFTDRKNPQSVMWCGGFGSADWFHNYVQNVTFDVGRDNPGAIGLQFYSNNSGAVRDCRFTAGEGSGLTGLDLSHRDMNGPLLVRNCEVVGFRRGVSCARAVNGHVFERLTLRGQSDVGFENEGQAVSVRGLASDNAVPALRVYGTTCLIDSRLDGRAGAEHAPAIVNYNGGRLFVRDLTTSGYRRAIGDVNTPDSSAAFRIDGPDKPGSEGPRVAEYSSHPPTNLFPSPGSSLRLAIEESPVVTHDPLSAWANVDDFGADPTGGRDSSEAIQKAIDSGATSVFLPGFYALDRTVVIRGAVKRVHGIGGWIDHHGRAKPDFRVADGAAPVVTIEHLANVRGGIEIDTARTVFLRSVADADLAFTRRAEGGALFLEDVVTHGLAIKNQRVWARQLNVENEGTHVRNDGGALWILGYKTERGGTLLETRGRGRSEVLGGFSYTTTAGRLAPMFVNDESSLFAFFGEVCFNGDPFATLVRETRAGETKELKRGDGATTPYAGAAEPPGDATQRP